jgi:polyketide synthase PksL/polyketide synthase PksN
MDYYRQNREYMNVINWSLWEDGGMTLDDSTMKLYKEVKGLKPLSTQPALEVMDKIIKSTYNQVVVIDGQKDKIEKALGKNKNEKTLTDSSSVNATEMREYVFLKLKKMIHNMLKVKENHIKIDDDFSKFGFNSITFTQYANEINDAFKVAITPAIFFEYTMIDSFTDYIMDKYAKEVEESYSNSSSTVIKKSANEKVIKRPIRNMKKINIQDNKSIKVEDNKVTNKETEFAVIGMDGMMPMSENLDEFFEHLVSEDDLISEIPQERWDYKEYYSETGHEPNKTFAKWGGFMKEIDKFDSGFFSISPREAELMDPQQRLFLQSVWKTIEDAGYNPRSLAGSKTGLFVGVSTIDYYDMMKEKGVPLDAQLSTGVSHCLLANRISYLLDLHGPSEPVDTACSSSLIAIHRAISSIMSGDCELAIAGGVNILASPMLFITFGKAGMLSKDGRCKAFDKSANGYVRGEGVGSILIKPLSKAEADGDHIYGVIKSTAINHGGKVNSITSPNPNAQKELLKTAYEKANINPATVSYIEAHGTGTSLGDPIEINALNSAFTNMIKQYDDDIDNTNYIGIGTVKTNIGHLETAAGIAGVLKVLLSFKHKKIPGNVHLKEVNPYINLEDSPFYLVKRTQHWEAIKDKHGNKYPRRAGISSFGFGGANAHVVLEEYNPPNDISTPITQNKEQLIVLSARNEDRLKEYTKLLLAYLQKTSRHEHYLTLLHDDILNILAQSLQIEKEYIGQEELQEYGMDAISYNDFVRKISSQYNIEFNNITMEEHNTVNKILKLLESEHINKIREYYKSNNNLDISLDDIAYTLQVGRDAMDYRLACVSTSIEQLINGLTGYLDDKPIAGVCVGSSKRTDREKGNISEEESIIRIAEKWVKGTDYDWEDAFSGQKCLRISLPTYPFLRKRHWFDKLISNTTPSHKDYKITSSLETKSLNKHKIEHKTEDKKIDKTIDKATTIEPYTYKKVYNTYNTKDNPYTGNEVTLEIIHNHIALVIMEDKENKNMFSESLIQGLEFTFDKIHQNKDIKVVVVTGYDNVFSMGGTQHQLNAIADEKNQFTDIPFLFRGFLESEIPVISAMQGHASGGGMLFGLYADMVVMSNESIYTASFMKYGFTPGMGATYILKEKLGANVATEMMYTAKYYKGEDLKNKGASVIFRDRKDVLNEALSIAKQLIDKPRNTLKVLKEELSRRAIDQLTHVLDSEVIMHNKTFTDNEVKKRIYAQFNQGKQKTKYNTLQHIIDGVARGELTPEKAQDLRKQL